MHDEVPCYPDTLVWIRDFTYSYNEPWANMYFWHPSFDDYPVVGITWKQANAFSSSNDWIPINGYYHADSVHEYTTRGDPASFGQKVNIERSRFNLAIEIERDYIRFTSKTMLPIMSILVLAYLGLFLPNREFETITSIMTGTVLSVVFFHVDLSGRLNVGYTVAMDYAFYAIYGLLAVELFLSIIAWHKTTKNTNDISIKYLFWFMRALYPIVFAAGTILIIAIYDLN